MPEEIKKHDVTVFSTPTCPWCVMAKKYLTEKEVEFKNIDVSIDYKAAKDMMDKSGEMGVPQFWIDGKVIVGFDRITINKLLGLNK